MTSQYERGAKPNEVKGRVERCKKNKRGKENKIYKWEWTGQSENKLARLKIESLKESRKEGKIWVT